MGRRKGSGHGRAGGKRNQPTGGGGASGGRVHPSLRPSVKRASGLPELGRFSGKMEQLLHKQKVRQNLAPPTAPEDEVEPPGKRRRCAGPAAGTSTNAPAMAQMAALLMDAAKRGQDFAARQDFLTEQSAAAQAQRANRSKEISKRRFWREFQKVVHVSDVLLEVLDARDPLGGRLADVEKAIESQHAGKKQFVLVLNKVDLVPRENAERWLEYFRVEGMPVVAFSAAAGGKAAAQERSKSKGADDPSRRCVDHLFDVLHRLQLTEGGGRRKITVGVIGYPNVGKSSVINALKRQRVVGVGNTAGFTTALQEVQLQQHIRVMDCPGVVMAAGEEADVVLRNAMKVEQVADPIRPVELIWDRCGAARLAFAYHLPEAEIVSFEVFVRILAQKTGRLRKGGEANADDVCRQVLRDWNDGKIPFFTVPPSDRDVLTAPQTLDAADREQDTMILTSLSAANTGFLELQPSRQQALTYGVDDERLQRRGMKRRPGEDEQPDEDSGAEHDAFAEGEYDDRPDLEMLARDVARVRLAESHAAATTQGRRRVAARRTADEEEWETEDSDAGEAKSGRQLRLAKKRAQVSKRLKTKEARAVRKQAKARALAQ